MRYATSTSMNLLFDFNYQVNATTQLTRIAQCGFKNIDMNFCDWSIDETSPFRAKSWKKWVEGLKEKAQELNITFNQAHGPMMASVLSKNDLMNEMSFRSIEGAGILGVRWIVFHAGHFPGSYDQDHLLSMKYENLKWFDKIVDFAAKNNVGIAIENMFSYVDRKTNILKRAYLDQVEDHIDLVDAFNSPYVGICWDTGHANVQGVDQRKSLQAIGKRLKALHIADNNSLSDQHYAPYYGNIDWECIIKTLHEIGYEGEFTFETAQFIRDRLPDDIRDYAIRLLNEIGEYIVTLGEKEV